MMPAISTTLATDAQGRSGRGLDPGNGGDQTFGSMLADLTDSATTQSEAASATTPAGNTGLATIPPSIAAALSAAADPTAAQSPVGTTWRQSVQSLLARFTPASAAGAQAAGRTVSGADITTAPTPALPATTLLGQPAKASGAAVAVGAVRALPGAADATPSTETQPATIGQAARAVSSTWAVHASMQRAAAAKGGMTMPNESAPAPGTTLDVASGVLSAVAVNSQASIIAPARAPDEAGVDTDATSTDKAVARPGGADPAALSSLVTAVAPLAVRQAPANGGEAPAPAAVDMPGTARLAAAGGVRIATPVTTALLGPSDPIGPHASGPTSEDNDPIDPPSVKVTLVDATSHAAPSLPVPFGRVEAGISAAAPEAAAPGETAGLRASTTADADIEAPKAVDATSHAAPSRSAPPVGLEAGISAAAPEAAAPGGPTGVRAPTTADADEDAPKAVDAITGGTPSQPMQSAELEAAVAPSTEAAEPRGTPAAVRPASGKSTPPFPVRNVPGAPSEPTSSEPASAKASPPEAARPASADVAASPTGETETAATTDRHASAPDAVQTALSARGAETAAAAVRTIAHAVTTLAADVADSAAPAAAPRIDDATTPKPSSAPAPARSLTLQLSPADLGSVTVHLKLRDGALDVHLAVDDQKTLGLITHARDALSSAIGDGATPLNSLVIQGGDSASPQAAGSHDQANANRGASGAGQESGAGGNGGRGGDGPAQRQARGTPARDTRTADPRGADGLFV